MYKNTGKTGNAGWMGALKTSSEKKKHILSKVLLKNTFATGVAFITELHSRK